MSELEELIRINKNIENQNREIIRLLKIIAGEADFVDRSGYVIPEFEEPEEVYPEADEFSSLLDVTCDVGEVYFIDGDIFKLSGKVAPNFGAVLQSGCQKGVHSMGSGNGTSGSTRYPAESTEA